MIRDTLFVRLRVAERKRNSEAGNRTPVVRVTGGNTKPLYYFGSVNPPKPDYMKHLLLSLDDAMNNPR